MDEHTHKLLCAFASVLKAEDALGAVKTQQQEAETRFMLERSAIEAEMTDAWAEVEKLMAESGEYEVTLPGDATDFKIGWGATRESVKVEPDAVPDEFCKVERKPKLKEIGDHLKALRQAGAALPNWGRLETTPRKLGWKAVKKSTAKA